MIQIGGSVNAGTRLLSPPVVLMAPDATRVSNTLEDRNNAAAEVVKVVSSSMLGLTVGCARAMTTNMTLLGSMITIVFERFLTRSSLNPGRPTIADC